MGGGTKERGMEREEGEEDEEEEEENEEREEEGPKAAESPKAAEGPDDLVLNFPQRGAPQSDLCVGLQSFQSWPLSSQIVFVK